MSKTNTARKPKTITPAIADAILEAMNATAPAAPILTDAIAASILDAMNAVAPPAPKAKRVKQPIPNIAKLTTVALLAALAANGADYQHASEDEDGEPTPYTRDEAIQSAKDAGLWDYSGNVVPLHYKQKYGAAQNCGDAVSTHLVRPAGMDQDVHLAFLADVADANEILFSRWDHCNYGQKVMNLGNVLRGKIKRGEYVIVGTTEWNPDAV